MTASTTSKVIISAQDVSAGYGGKAVWQHATFTINAGELVGVLGPNGVGKSTLLRLILGLNKPLAGTLEVFGAAPRRGNPRIGFVPQRRPIDAEMNIEALELVRLGVNGIKWGMSIMGSLRAERAEAMAALRQVDGEMLAYRPLGELSGGELQRVFLAQALVGNPELLLLDEPLANLDIRRERELIQLIYDVARTRNVAILLIAHDLNPLLPVADKIIYTVNGKMTMGSVDQIVTAKTLSALYGAPIEVLHDSQGRIAVLGIEEVMHHD